MTEKKVSTAMPTSEEEYRTPVSTKPKKLALDNDSYKPTKTRSELYREMEAMEKKLEEDIFSFASPINRGAALVIDILFIFSVVIVALELAPYQYAVAKHFLDLYQMQFMFATETLLKVLDVLNVIFAVLLTHVVPLAFFNNSLGKKIMRLKVRGEDFYTISLTRAFQREIIFKPISVVCLAGLIMPLATKNKQSLHDKMANTFVINDEA